MRLAEQVEIYGRGGLRGTADRLPDQLGDEELLLVRLHQGDELLVPAVLLSARGGGGYDLDLGPEELRRHRETAQAGDGPIVIPVAEERLRVGKRQVETGKVVVRKTVSEREEVVDQPLVTESVEVERVPVNRFVDRPAETRQEGDVTIVPVMEEVLVVEKRLRLKEELRLTRRRSEEHRPQTVKLRQEEVHVERQGGGEGAVSSARGRRRETDRPAP